jgi:Xaa-Pro aminopeptidase
LERGDFVVIDFGAVYSGYHSDMTRTFVIGRASDRRREIYEAVLRAQTAALSIIKDGEKISEADKAAREILKEAELDKYFTHSLGHGVGLEIHERPNVGSRSSEIFRAGMVATVEPGVYIPGFGGVRIEDMCAVKFGGIDNLTNFPKELMEL